MKKILLVATVQSHICQFHKPLVEVLREQENVEIHVAARDNLEEKDGLKLDFVDKVYNVQFHRSPFSYMNMFAYKELKQIIAQEKYDIIQCNTPVGGVLARIAARKWRKKGTKVIYTAHGFHFYKGASLINWMLYFPIEFMLAKFTDVLVTINEEDYKRAKRFFPCDVARIHGVGVDSDLYTKRSNIESNLEGLNVSSSVILCVGELLKNKNQEMAIQAMKEVVGEHPDAMLLIAGNGPEKERLEHIIEDLSLEDNVKLIGYKTNLEQYQNLCCILVSCSKREGLGLNVIEGMLSGNPIVATRNRGHNELVKDGKNGYLVEQNQSHEMALKIIELLNDREKAAKIGEYGRKLGMDYSKSSVKNELRNILGGVDKN